MENYIKINGQKIGLTDSQVNELKANFGIASKQLSEIPVGGIFKIGNHELVILEHLAAYSVVIKRNKYGTDIHFGSNNNYDGSNVDERCNEFGKEIAEIIGKENMHDFELDLTANDGMKCYGTVKRRAALRTADMQRKYAYIFDDENILPKFHEWTATAYSTPKHNDSTGVECVSPLGNFNCFISFCINVGVRPFCILKSNIFVSE